MLSTPSRHRSARVLLPAALAAWLLVPTPATAAQGEVHEFRLGNGLRILVKEDHRAPVAVSQLWYRVGSSYEQPGATGISHLLEHLMFKGTPRHPAGEFSRIIAQLGGRENAFTGRDYTAYFQTLAADRLEKAFELEADRMAHLLLDEAEFLKEREVVMEERRLRTEDDPEALTYEALQATAFLHAPYRNPVIGWMDDLRRLSVEQVRRWYRRWYGPDNAVLVVVGDVDPERILALARKHFGPLPPRREAVPEAPLQEPALRGERRVTVRAPAKVPYLILGYRVPSLRTAAEPWEAYALDVAAAVLAGGESARLPRELVRGRRLAAAADAGYSAASRLETLFLLDATPAPGRSVAELEQALREEVRRLREELVSAAELERIKTQVIAADVYQRDSMFYQAMVMGRLESVGLGWRLMEEYVDRIRAVTPEQVQAVAKRYLVDERLTVAVLDPLPLAAPGTGGEGPGHGKEGQGHER